MGTWGSQGTAEVGDAGSWGAKEGSDSCWSGGQHGGSLKFVSAGWRGDHDQARKKVSQEIVQKSGQESGLPCGVRNSLTLALCP